MIINIMSQLCRNYYVQLGFEISIRIRRTLATVIFDKVVNLSMKSLITTNSGKLVSVLSADLFAIERNLAYSSLIITFPVVNIFTYVLIGITNSWVNSLIVFCVWIVMLLVQICSGKLSKRFQMNASSCNEERLKLVNDMVLGVRTLKSYGWENHYLQKISAVRSRQTTWLYILNFLRTLGFNLF